jgi:hypothetical protein
MSRLFRGRKLLAASLRDFAAAEGYVRSEGDKPAEKAETIDLEKYRATRAGKEGSR